jgi:MFS family permease
MSQPPTTSPRLVALRSRDFQLLWVGELISITGSQMQIVAVNWHIYELLRGTTYDVSILGINIDLGAAAMGLGILGLIRVLPIIVFGLIGGAMADTVDRRKLMLWTRTIAAVFAAILAIITLAHQDTIGWIYLLTAAGSATTAFDNPARQSLVPSLVPREHLTNAISLMTLLFQIATIIGPAFAGILIGHYNIGIIYAINALTFFAAIFTVTMMRYRGKPSGSLSAGLSLSAMMEGLRFTYRSRIIWGTMLLDFFATFFSSARTMLPLIADGILGAGPLGYGLLSAAQPVGAVIAGAIMALRKDVYRQGVVLLVSVAIYGLATAVFGIATSFALAFVMLALTGAGDTVSTVIRGTIRQIMTPDHLRGRMTGVNMIFFMGGPQLGELEAGFVAAAFGAPFAILTGGIATVLLTGWIAWKYPRLRDYTSDTAAQDLRARSET